MAEKNFSREVFKKSHKGRLHRALGVPEGQTIPAEKMQAALRGDHGEAARQMAQGAKNASGK